MPMAIDYGIRLWRKERHFDEIRILTPRCENSLYVITRVILFLKSSEPVQIETTICF